MYISDKETRGQEIRPDGLALNRLGDGLSSLGQCPSRSPSGITSAEHQFTEQDAAKLFQILGGPSPWQGYLAANLRASYHQLPGQPIKILPSISQKHQHVFGQPLPPDVQGFVDRRNALIYLAEFPKGRRFQSMVGLALHEAVHLFSHPPGKSNRLRATVYGFLGTGLLEGLTQVVTEDIQTCQGIRPMRSSWQAFEHFTPVARRFVEIFSRPIVGDAFFNGRISPLHAAIRERWTEGNYVRVRNLTDQDNAQASQAALSLIASLELSYRFRPKIFNLR